MKSALLLCTTALSIVWGSELQEESQKGSESSPPQMVRENAFCLSPPSEVITLYPKEIQEKLTELAEIQKKALEFTMTKEHSAAIGLYRTLSSELETLNETYPQLHSDENIINLRVHALYGLVNSLWKLNEPSELLPLLSKTLTIKPSDKETESFKKMLLNAYICNITAASNASSKEVYERTAALQEGFLGSMDAVLSIEERVQETTKEVCLNTLYLVCLSDYYAGKHENVSVLLDKIEFLSKGRAGKALLDLVEHFNEEGKWAHLAKARDELEKRDLLSRVPEELLEKLDSAKEKVKFLETAQKSLPSYIAAVENALNPNYAAAAEALEGWLTTVEQLAEREILTWVSTNVLQFSQHAITLVQLYTKLNNLEKALHTLDRVSGKWDIWWSSLTEEEKEGTPGRQYVEELLRLSTIYLQLNASSEVERVLDKIFASNPSIVGNLNYLSMRLDLQILNINKFLEDEKHEEISSLAEHFMEGVDSIFEKFPAKKGKLLELLTKELEKIKESCQKVGKEDLAKKITNKVTKWSSKPEVAEQSSVEQILDDKEASEKGLVNLPKIAEVA